MNSADLSKILEEHKVWITSMRESGSRADLRDADLFGANLCGADLRGADLRDADLFGADLL
ncbi:pentapeptide repeat-containing protein, partial [Salmonella enterica]|nr:pentapeptide repeat-containing protein [Salmonella enterica]